MRNPALRKAARDPNSVLVEETPVVKLPKPRRHRQYHMLDADPYVLQRQSDAYDLRVSGATINQIMELLQLRRESVLADIEAEDKRRNINSTGSKRRHLTLSVSRYERVILRTEQRLKEMDARAKAGGKEAANAKRMAWIEDKVIMEAQKRIDTVLGLNKADVEENPVQKRDEGTKLIGVFMQMSLEDRLALLKEARERKSAPALKNVTPALEG